MNDRLSPRPAVWRALGFTAIFLLVAAVLIIGLVSSGLLDPRPAGPLQTELPARTVPVAGGEEIFDWQTGVALPAPPYSVRLEASTEGGGTVAYGLALGTPENYLVLAVSPAGYAAVSHHAGEATEALSPWRPVAHVPVGQAGNELGIDVEKGALTVWVNKQVLWQGSYTAPPGQLALLARSDGGPATVSFASLQLFAASPP